jgi:hypothetical protein
MGTAATVAFSTAFHGKGLGGSDWEFGVTGKGFSIYGSGFRVKDLTVGI